MLLSLTVAQGNALQLLLLFRHTHAGACWRVSTADPQHTAHHRKHTLTSSAAVFSITLLMLSMTSERLRSSNMVLYCSIMPGDAVEGGMGPSCCFTSLSCSNRNSSTAQVHHEMHAGICVHQHNCCGCCSRCFTLTQAAVHHHLLASELTTEVSTNATRTACPAWPTHCGMNTSHHCSGTP